MSKTTFLGLTGRNNNAVNTEIKSKKNVSNPIKNNNLDYSFEANSNTDNNQIVDDKSAKAAIVKAQKENDKNAEYYSESDNKFKPTDILDSYEITKNDLQYATGEQLLGLYFEADYSQDNDYKEHNAMLMTLLSNASTSQIKEFMNTFESVTQNDEDWNSNYNFSYDNLGKQLLYAARAKDITGEDEYNNFMENVAKNPDLFPSYNEYIGIAYGNQL